LPFNGEHLARVISVAVIATIHILLLCFLVFDIELVRVPPDPPVTVMKLVDIEEYTPPPPPPLTVAQPIQNTAETVAEEIIEVEEPVPSAEVSAPVESAETSTETVAGPDYLPPHKISVPPEFDRRELHRRTVYPPIAQRSGIEGTVYLDLFIDREGYVRNVVVLKETPEGRGFADAAIKAFQDFRASPAQANGKDVAVRYRWLFRFTLQ
jgi:protein TonB